MIKKYWNKFNIITRDHFYHTGANIKNRKAVVEALVCNFDTNNFAQHNQGVKEKASIEQLELF